MMYHLSVSNNNRCRPKLRAVCRPRGDRKWYRSRLRQCRTIAWLSTFYGDYMLTTPRQTTSRQHRMPRGCGGRPRFTPPPCLQAPSLAYLHYEELYMMQTWGLRVWSYIWSIVYHYVDFKHICMSTCTVRPSHFILWKQLRNVNQLEGRRILRRNNILPTGPGSTNWRMSLFNLEGLGHFGRQACPLLSIMYANWNQYRSVARKLLEISES